MAVNGIEIKVGQVWKTCQGFDVTIRSRTGSHSHPWVDCEGNTYTDSGVYGRSSPGPQDLHILLNDAPDQTDPAPAPVPQAVELTAFPDISEESRAVGAAKMSTVHERTVHERTVVAYTALGAPYGAPDLLDAAAGHLRDRAATYDKPEGERSMAQTVAIFNQFHGTELTEAQGWHFMQILKDVRLFTNVKAPHRDSVDDCIAYSALKGEAILKGGAQ